MSDPLTFPVAEIIEDNVEIGLASPYLPLVQVAHIIALIRADERKRIRKVMMADLRPAAKSLASEIDVDFDWLTETGNDKHGFAQDYYRSAWHMLNDALTAIGIPEEKP